MEILRLFNTATTIYFPLVDKDATDFEDTPVTIATGDAQRSIDGAAFSDTANPVHEGGGIYSIALVAGDLNGALIVVRIIDQTATKLWEDTAVIIATYGNASAQHAFDLDSATVTVGTNNDKLGYTLSATGVDAIWDEDIVAAHGTSDTSGLLLRVLGALISQRSNNPTLNAILGVADVASRDSPEQIWLEAVRTLTAITGTPRSDLFGEDATFAAAVGTRIANLDDLDAAITTRATPAQVNTEVSDVLKTDTIAELTSGIPAVTPTFEAAIMRLYMGLTKEITVDGSEKTYANDAGVVIWKKVLTDDGSLYTEAKGVSGP